MSNTNEKAIKEAVVSLKMEGFIVTEHEKQLCQDVLEGNISFESVLDMFIRN